MTDESENRVPARRERKSAKRLGRRPGGAEHQAEKEKLRARAIVLLEANDWDMSGTARELGINTVTLWRWLAKSDEYKEYLRLERRKFSERLRGLADKIVDRLISLTPDEDDYKTLANALAIVMEKRLLIDDELILPGPKEPESPGEMVDVKARINFLVQDVLQIVEVARRTPGIIDSDPNTEGEG